MANVVVDPKVHPEAIVGDFSKPNPLVTFKTGGRRVRLRQQMEAALLHQSAATTTFVFPAQWDVHNKVWRQLMCVKAGTDWWTAHYPAEQMQRPTGPLCDGCHSVNYNIHDQAGHRMERRLREMPRARAALTSRKPSRDNIVNPARLDSVRANDVCIQCHSQGQPIDQSDQREVLRLARRLRARRAAQRRLEAGRAQTRRDDLHSFRRRTRPTRIACRATISCTSRDVYARRDLLQLPRRPRHAEQRGRASSPAA